MLNFESSNQSIFHSVLPIGFGLAMVSEDTSSVNDELVEQQQIEAETDNLLEKHAKYASTTHQINN